MLLHSIPCWILFNSLSHDTVGRARTSSCDSCCHIGHRLLSIQNQDGEKGDNQDSSMWLDSVHVIKMISYSYIGNNPSIAGYKYAR